MPNPFSGIFGGQQPQQQRDPSFENEDLNLPDPESGEVEDNDPFSALGDIFNTDPEDEDEQKPNQLQQQQQVPNNQQQQQQPNPEEALAREIQDMISAMTVPESVIPENFDPSDPKQFRDVLAKSNQTAALTTLQLAFKPMQAAMKALAEDVRNEIRQQIQQSNGATQSKTILASIVPEVNDPNLSGLVNNLFETASQKHKDPTRAAQAVRAGLNAMNIRSATHSHQDPSQAGSSGGSNQASSGLKTGKSALDMFSPMPQSRPAQGQNQQGQNRQNQGRR